MEETAGTSSKGERKSKRKSGEVVLDISVNFPTCEKFQPPTKLPTLKSVLGRMRFLCRAGMGARNMKVKEAANEVGKEVYSKFYHNTICCMTLYAIIYRIEKEYKIMMEENKRVGQKGKEGSTALKKLAEQVEKKDRLFDVYLDPEKDREKRQKCEDEWGVKMSEAEFRYLEDQKTERKMECNSGVDPVWFRAVMRRQRLREVHDQEYLRAREENFRGKSLQ